MDYYRKIGSAIDSSDRFEEDYSISAIQKGNLIHKFCEHYRLGMDGLVLMEKVCKSFGISYNDDIGQELQPYINNYLKQYNEDYDEVYIERPFYLKVKDSFITGVIDRINIKDKRAEIIDFKTNSVNNKRKLIGQYEPQLQLYAYVVKEIMGIDIDKARISFLANGDYGDIDIGEKKLEENISNIEGFIEFVSEHSRISDYRKSEKCSIYCKHKSICDLE